MSMQVSVVVPTYRRPGRLERCLKALLNQDFDPDAYEIIIVDDAGCPETKQLVENFVQKAVSYHYLARPRTRVSAPSQAYGITSEEAPDGDGMLVGINSGPEIRYLTAVSSTGPAAARNIGWQAARGEVVAFTDDDCIPAPNWIEQGLASFDKDTAGVSGRVEVPLPDEPTDYQKNASWLARSKFVTANCFYLKRALEKTGGFDENFTTAWREDSDLYFRMLKRSFKLRVSPSAVVLHPVRSAPWGVSLKQQRKAMYNALLFKKHPRLYRQYVQSTPPLKYYAIVLTAIAGLAAIALRAWPIAILMIILWAVQTAHFARTRLTNSRRDLSHMLEMVFTSILIPPIAIFWRLYGALRFGVLFF